jgi:hypothetical protein
MPAAPIPYNGKQSRLEYYALNGNASVNQGLGRPDLLKKTSLYYQTPFAEKTNEYGLTQTNAISDATTPNRGKGTNTAFDLLNTANGYAARYVYTGGDAYDIDGYTTKSPGGSSIPGNGIGRNAAILYNITTFGYGVDTKNPTDTKTWYKKPDTTLNAGQKIII